MNMPVIIHTLSLLALGAALLPAPAFAGITLREAQSARRDIYRAQLAKHEEKRVEVKLQKVLKAHQPWLNHVRALHKDLRLFYGQTGSNCLFLCDDMGETSKLSEDDFAERAFDIELPEPYDSDFSALDGSDKEVRITELYPCTLSFRCQRVLEVSPERLRLFAGLCDAPLGSPLGVVQLIILHPTDKQRNIKQGDRIREYFIRVKNEDGNSAVDVPRGTMKYPVLKSYNTLKDDTRRPQIKRRGQQKRGK